MIDEEWRDIAYYNLYHYCGWNKRRTNSHLL